MKSFAPIRRRRAGLLLTCLCLLALCAIRLLDARNKIASELCSIHASGVSRQWNRREPIRPVDYHDVHRWSHWHGGADSVHQTRPSTEGDKVTGEYRCSPGNALCRNGDEKGSIEGTANGNQVNLNTILLPDASNCRFTGTLDYNGNGQYTCYLQGRIVEQGTWQLSK